MGLVNPSPISGADAAKPSVGIGGVTPVDGPSPSILGSIDNIFQSVKEYDQYHCLERMLWVKLEFQVNTKWDKYKQLINSTWFFEF